MIRRREFITLLGCAAAWPLAADAQQGERVRRIGVLTGANENDPVWKARISAFTQALAGLGWTEGRNVRMDLRSGGGEINRIRASAQELVGLQPDIILAASTPATVALQRETRTIPIVFANVSDPVASGMVERSTARVGTSQATADKAEQSQTFPRRNPMILLVNPPFGHICL
jgi:putative ABC transport system substrate-binding protein